MEFTDNINGVRQVGLFCGCDDEIDDLKANHEIDLIQLETEYLETIAETESAHDLAKNSLTQVTAKWIKYALYSLGHYDNVQIGNRPLAREVNSAEFTAATVNAVKSFQCNDYHDRLSDGRCSGNATGWLTFEEARTSICWAGYQGIDHTTFELIDWFTDERVFAFNLAKPKYLIEKLLSNIPELVQQQKNDRASLKELEDRAKIYRNSIDRLIEKEIATVGKEKAAELRAYAGLQLEERQRQIISAEEKKRFEILGPPLPQFTQTEMCLRRLSRQNIDNDRG